MDPDLASAPELDIEYLARKYWIPVDQVRRVIELTSPRHTKEVEDALALVRRVRYERELT